MPNPASGDRALLQKWLLRISRARRRIRTARSAYIVRWPDLAIFYLMVAERRAPRQSLRRRVAAARAEPYAHLPNAIGLTRTTLAPCADRGSPTILS